VPLSAPRTRGAAVPKSAGGGGGGEKLKKKSKSVKPAAKAVAKERMALDECLKLENAMDDLSDEEEGELEFSSILEAAPPPPASASRAPPAPAPSGGKEGDKRSKMNEILHFQSANGSFPASKELMGHLGVSMDSFESVMKKAESLGKVSNADLQKNIWATILVLSYFKKKLADLADEWEMVESKARRWINNQKAGDLQDAFSLAFTLLS